ncbi:hypothetical protein ACTXJR_08000 [Glutamicibacter ardleyensis]|uniref:hypothetical protein n=1 Tax=Glutamicibacter ardleyensis TaxID=225894 RepID=UPI003F961526
MEHHAIDQEKLHRYLSQHLLGSESGLNHFEAAKDTWAGTAHEERFTSLYKQVEADQKDLESLMDRLGFPRGPLAQVAAPVAKLAGLVNPFNPFRQRKISAAQVQLDVLTGLLNAKLRMWQTLLLMLDAEPRLDRALLEDLEQRALSQISQLVLLSDETWDDRFAPSPTEGNSGAGQ